MSSLRPVILRLRRQFLRHRRVLAAALAAAAVLAAVEAVSPAPPPTSPVVVAAHDLRSGSLISPDDVRLEAYDPDAAPDGVRGSVDAVVGSTVAGPMRVGEALTDRRLLGPGLLAGYDADLVAAPVRIGDAGVVALLRVGDRIAVYAADGDPSSAAELVVSGADVVALPPVPDDRSTEGALMVLAVTSAEAAALAQKAATTQVSVTLLR